jgi:hypothetical protein
MVKGCTCLKDYNAVCPCHPLAHHKAQVLGRRLIELEAENKRLRKAPPRSRVLLAIEMFEEEYAGQNTPKTWSWIWSEVMGDSYD